MFVGYNARVQGGHFWEVGGVNKKNINRNKKILYLRAFGKI